jgi:cytochrome bd-type quinol oxidase subunit 2
MKLLAIIANSGLDGAGGLDQASDKLLQTGQKAYGTSATLPSNNLETVVGNVIQYFLGLLGILFLALAIYGGYLWMMARGDEKQVEKARDTIKSAVIGLAIILGAYAITSFVIANLIAATTGQGTAAGS